MVASQSLLAKKYAKAYLNVFSEDIAVEDIKAVEKFALFLKKSRSAMFLICSVNILHEQKVKVLSKLFEHFNVDRILQKLIVVMLKRNDLCLLPQVLQDVYCLYKDQHDIIDLNIISAELLDEEEEKFFQNFFAKLSGKQLLVSTQIDSSLLAGVRLQSNTFLWDYSVASRLRSLRNKLFVEG